MLHNCPFWLEEELIGFWRLQAKGQGFCYLARTSCELGISILSWNICHTFIPRAASPIVSTQHCGVSGQCERCICLCLKQALVLIRAVYFYNSLISNSPPAIQTKRPRVPVKPLLASIESNDTSIFDLTISLIKFPPPFLALSNWSTILPPWRTTAAGLLAPSSHIWLFAFT